MYICFILSMCTFTSVLSSEREMSKTSLIQLNVLHVHIRSKCTTTILMIIVKINEPNLHIIKFEGYFRDNLDRS